jgi:hypothetical protein
MLDFERHFALINFDPYPFLLVEAVYMTTT